LGARRAAGPEQRRILNSEEIMNTQDAISRTEEQLIMAGAAVAANNQQSFQGAFDELTNLGVGVDEIRFAAGVGRAVREKPAAEMGRFVEKVFGVDPVETAGSKSCPAKQVKNEAHHRLMMLIAVASAVAANCEPCLSQAVLALADGGFPGDEVRIAAEIGLEVKALKAEDMRDAAVVLTGIDEERRAA
jgi:alkylhydroperoxidase/carboxymuconolactone decarboxylase family protein YurZ